MGLKRYTSMSICVVSSCRQLHNALLTIKIKLETILFEIQFSKILFKSICIPQIAFLHAQHIEIAYPEYLQFNSTQNSETAWKPKVIQRQYSRHY